MSIESLYHFFFESFAGVGILVLAGLVISVLVCVIMEWRTRQTFKDRGEVEDDDDDFTFFDACGYIVEHEKVSVFFCQIVYVYHVFLPLCSSNFLHE